MSTPTVAIGEFSRLTHLTVKTLRHYHEQGLLVPDRIDPFSGYRYYATDQVADALLIGRLRALDMPLAEVRRVLASTEVGERDAVIADHLRRMEQALDRTRTIVASLRGLLTATPEPRVERRTVPDLVGVAATARVEHSGIEAWCAQAFAGLYASLRQPPPARPGRSTAPISSPRGPARSPPTSR